MGQRGERIGEFEMIARYFAPLAAGEQLAFGLRDDAALLEVPEGKQLVVTKDMMVAGVHFLPDDPADLIARKLLRVNLSDLAAMGAVPAGYLLGLALPESVSEAWVADFAAGLAADQTTFGVPLIGGDTVAIPGPLTLSLTALGTIDRGTSLRRSGAKPGDQIYVSGSVGDAAIGLKMLQGSVRPSVPDLVDRYRLPRPRLALGQALTRLASAAADVSDGLIADLGHICAASGVGAVVDETAVPVSPEVRAILDKTPDHIVTVLTGGDDYELVFTAPESAAEDIKSLAGRLDLAISPIGWIEATPGVRVTTAGGGVRDLGEGGFTHF